MTKLSKQQKIDELLMLDFRKSGNREKLLDVLHRTKWLKNFKLNEITMEVLEKLYRKVSKKYKGRIGYVQQAGDDSWAFMIKNSTSHKWIYTIYAEGLEEGLMKTLVVLYSHFVKGIKFKT